jgi:hypothetical protein
MIYVFIKNNENILSKDAFFRYLKRISMKANLFHRSRYCVYKKNNFGFVLSQNNAMA